MSKNINVQMKQFNGTDYDNIYPDAKNGMAAQIIVTPASTLSSIKATSSNGTVFNGVFKNPNWIIEVNEYGNYTIQGTKTAGGTDSTELIVDECKQYEVSFIKFTLDDNSWEVIRAVSDAGTGESYWAVGDAKQITINGTIGTVQYNNYKPWVYILGFNHNASREGNNRIHFGCFRSEQNYSGTNSIALDDSRYRLVGTSSKNFVMNFSNTTSGGWESCQMRTIILNSDATSPSSAAANTFLKALPSDLKAVMKQCTKYTDNNGLDGNSSSRDITATNDWVWLLSEFEIFGDISLSNGNEQSYQKQYEYYINGNSKVKYRQSTVSETAYWWMRSPYSNSPRYFCLAGLTGKFDSGESDGSFGLAPAFCV